MERQRRVYHDSGAARKKPAAIFVRSRDYVSSKKLESGHLRCCCGVSGCHLTTIKGTISKSSQQADHFTEADFDQTGQTINPQDDVEPSLFDLPDHLQKMPRHCSVGGCKSRDTRENRKAGITFHRLPKRGKPRRTFWILNSQRTGPQGRGQWDPESQFIYFCSKHFTPDSFELSGVSGYRRLKDDALPTVFETRPRSRRGAAERGQRGVSKPAATQRRARRLPHAPELDSQAGMGSHQVGEAVARDTVKAEGAGWEEGILKKEGDPKTATKRGMEEPQQKRTLPPALSPPPSPPLPPCPGLSQIPPLSDSASLSPPPLPSDQPPASPPSLATPVPSTTPSTPSPPPSAQSDLLAARPASPSRYMRRLPPPPGFYLSREHSYAQPCPLVWKKRFDRAVDCLEKSARLLNAARRREARLRQTLLWLRGTRVRRGPLEWDGRGRRGRGRPSGGTERGNGSEEQRLREENLDLVAAELGKASEDGRPWSPTAEVAMTGSEDDFGFCFYCGRGQDDGEGWDLEDRGSGEQPARRQPSILQKMAIKEVDREMIMEEDQEEIGEDPGAGVEEGCYFYYYEDEEGGAGGRGVGLQVVTMEEAVPKPSRAPQLSDQASSLLSAGPLLNSEPLPPHAMLQTLQQPSSEAAAQQGSHGFGEQQLFWVQDSTDGRLLLLPVPPEEEDKDNGGGASVPTGTVLEATGQALLPLLVSTLGFQPDQVEGRGLEGGGGVMRSKGWGDSEAEARAVAVSGDVRERLKEHLEGFQLQLSTEFIH
ncbi:hypothetical protein GJAV_G00102570 [Gymnothorax javanicus]|nr:hypothetical protein GJAV_G00102570 [Gymnothorax javanicus]